MITRKRVIASDVEEEEARDNTEDSSDDLAASLSTEDESDQLPVGQVEAGATPLRSAIARNRVPRGW